MGGKWRDLDAMLCLPIHLILNKEANRIIFIVLWPARCCRVTALEAAGPARLTNTQGIWGARRWSALDRRHRAPTGSDQSKGRRIKVMSMNRVVIK